MPGLAILLAFYFIGMVFQQVVHVPLPSNVIGLALFAICLFLGFIKLKWVEKTAAFLNHHMMLFFVPIIVGTISFLPYIREHAVSMLVTLVGSWLVVLLSTGYTVNALARRGRGNSSGEASSSKPPLARRERS